MKTKKASVKHYTVYHVGQQSYDVVDTRSGEAVANYTSLATAFGFAMDAASRDTYGDLT